MWFNAGIQTFDSTSFLPRIGETDDTTSFSGFYLYGTAGQNINRENYLYFDINDNTWKKTRALDEFTLPSRGLAMENALEGEKFEILVKGTYSTDKFTKMNNNVYISPNEYGDIFYMGEEFFPDNAYCQRVGSALAFQPISDVKVRTILDVDFDPLYFKYHDTLGLRLRKLIGTHPSIPALNGHDIYTYMSTLPTDVYWFQPEGIEEPFEAYVNMEIEGGGWVLAGTLANDGNNYWTWDNFHNWDRGNDYGTIANAFQHDYQHKKVWTTVKANQILLTVNNSPNKYLVIDSILNDQTMASRWPSSTTNTGRYYVSKSVGSWWYQCGLGFALCHNDSDGYGNTWAVGFVAFAKNNHNCYFDDNTGGFNTHNNSDWEGYRTSDFWGQNVPYGSVMNIYIR